MVWWFYATCKLLGCSGCGQELFDEIIFQPCATRRVVNSVLIHIEMTAGAMQRFFSSKQEAKSRRLEVNGLLQMKYHCIFVEIQTVTQIQARWLLCNFLKRHQLMQKKIQKKIKNCVLFFLYTFY